MPQLTIEQGLAAAIKLHAAGHLAQAASIYRKILAVDAEQPDALNLLGVYEHQSGRHDVAIALLERATGNKPLAPHFFCNLGNALKAAGRPSEAIAAYKNSLKLDVGFAEAIYNLAGALQIVGQLDEAIAAYRRAIHCKPELFEAYLNLGSLLSQRGDSAAALKIYEQALVLRPQSAELYVNAANALSRMGRSEEAMAGYQSALKLNPDLPDALSSLASLLHNGGNLDGAAGVYEHAVRLSPSNPHVHSNLGNTLSVLGRVDEAERLCRRALELQPDLPEAWLNLGNSLGAQGRLDECLAAFAKAAELRPSFMHASSNRLYMMHLHSGYDSAALLREHRAWGELHGGPLRSSIRHLEPDRDPDRRLRIGYVSPDFIQHPVGRFMLPIVEQHDRTKVEVFCYAHVARADAATAEFREKADRWCDISAMSDEEAAELIRSDKIDILIDLAMHAAANRLLIFARKPAPVQATYLAYCSTTGLDAIDFRITDPYLDPPGVDEFYVEQSIRLPHCYWCYRAWVATPEVAPAPAIKSRTITFGCLNNVSKLTDVSLSLWCNVLKATPGSRMIVHAHDGLHRARILKSVEAAGVEPRRIEFVSRMDLHGYYGMYHRIDIGLDATPYAGGTTTCDALWMGVPVVTLNGETAVGRGGASILSNIGLSELIGQTREDYVAIAQSLAADEDRRIFLRATLRDRMLASPLMNEPQFVRDLEAVYRRMWATYLQRTALAPSL